MYERNHRIFTTNKTTKSNREFQNYSERSKIRENYKSKLTPVDALHPKTTRPELIP